MKDQLINNGMWEKLMKELKYFFAIALIMFVMAISVSLFKEHPFIGILLWSIFAYLLFGGLDSLKKDKHTALSVLFVFFLPFIIIVLYYIFTGSLK